MTWRKTWSGRRKKELSNSRRPDPHISFRSTLSQETLFYIKNLALQKKKSKFINQAIEMRYFYETNKKGFFVQIIQSNFSLCKHLLRQIGRAFAVTK